VKEHHFVAFCFIYELRLTLYNSENKCL